MDSKKLEELKQQLPDIQNLEDKRNKFINKVGVRNVKVPIKIKQFNNNVISTIGDCSIYTSISEKVKGANMSRYTEVLHEVIKESVSLDIVSNILKELRERLESDDSYVKIKFDYFIKKKAPVSKKEGYMNYKCIFEGMSKDNKDVIYLTVEVPYTSLCPCSAEISKYGAHNQRSTAKITVEINPDDIILIEQLVQIVELTASSQLYSVLKRPDEKYVTEKAYERPRFVEDMGRELSINLDQFLEAQNILDYVVVINHYESIHNHEAVAIINAGLYLK